MSKFHNQVIKYNGHAHNKTVVRFYNKSMETETLQIFEIEFYEILFFSHRVRSIHNAGLVVHILYSKFWGVKASVKAAKYM